MYTIPVVDLVYNRRKTASMYSTAQVEVRITYLRKQKYISTGIKVLPKQWRNGVIVQHEDSETLNLTISKMVSMIRKIILDMVNNEHIDIDSIPQKLTQMKAINISVVEYCQRKVSVRKYGKATATQKRYDRFIRFLDSYGKIKGFKDISEENIAALDLYLKKRKIGAVSRWTNYHRFINTFILYAMKDGYMTRNPYHYIKIDKGNRTVSIEKCLTPDEFECIKKAKMPTPHIERARDVFVFQTLTCLAYCDLKKFDISKIEDIDGKKAYVNRRRKTDRGFTIPMHPDALSILEKYDNKLPVISNVKYNEYLKIVAQASGIDKPITSHWARHTGATLLLNNGISMEIVAKICGHSSIKITEQIYAKMLDRTVVNAVTQAFS